MDSCSGRVSAWDWLSAFAGHGDTSPALSGIGAGRDAMHPDSAGSQFFIMHKKSPHLDGAYAAFGKITEGMDVVNKIADTATDYSDKPLEPQVMKKVTVETFGEEYGEPEMA